MLNKTKFPDNMPGKSSMLLIEAIRDGSNLEMEWLWFASRMTDMIEREYCLKRALYINPRNQATRHELYQIARLRRRVVNPKHIIEYRHNWVRSKTFERLRRMTRQIGGQFVHLLMRRTNLH